MHESERKVAGHSRPVILSLRLFQGPVGVLATGERASLQQESHKLPVDVLVKVSSLLKIK